MNKQKILILILVVAAILTSVFVVSADTSASYDINWWTVDGGGSELNGGDYTLTGTIGQPDVGELSAGEYTLNGGFWSRLADWVADTLEVYLPLIMR